MMDSVKSEQVKDDEINLFDYWRVIKRRKKLIGAIVIVVTVISIVCSLLLTKMYRAETVIMPVGGGGPASGLAAMAAQLSGLPLVGGMVGSGKTQAFEALLKTRTLAENIINKFDLMKVFYEDEWDKDRNEWKNPAEKPTMEYAVKILYPGKVQFSADKKMGTILISAEFSDPELAAKVANGYVEGLQELMNVNSFTSEKRNRIFVEEQLRDNKENLLNIGKEINEFYKEDRVSNIDSRVDVPLGEINDFVLGTRDVMTLNDANLDAARDNLGVRKNKLNEKLQTTKIVKDVPQQIYLQYLMLRRELLGKMNALLTQQYEMAKIEEAREDLAFQVIDEARVPIARFKPNRREIVMISFMASLIFAISLVFFLEYVSRLKQAAQSVHLPDGSHLEPINKNEQSKQNNQYLSKAQDILARKFKRKIGDSSFLTDKDENSPS